MKMKMKINIILSILFTVCIYNSIVWRFGANCHLFVMYFLYIP